MDKIKSIVLGTASKLAWAPPLLARIALGVVFIGTGWGKLHNLDKVIQFFSDLGIPAANIQAPFVAGVELVGGVLILLGLMTRLAAIPLMVTMAVAIFTAKMGDVTGIGDFLELTEFLYFILFFWLFTAGPGALSADRFICKDCAGVCSK